MQKVEKYFSEGLYWFRVYVEGEAEDRLRQCFTSQSTRDKQARKYTPRIIAS